MPYTPLSGPSDSANYRSEPSPAALKRAGTLIAMILTDMAYEKAEREARAEGEDPDQSENPDGSVR